MVNKIGHYIFSKKKKKKKGENKKIRPVALLDCLAQDFGLPCETSPNGNKKRMKLSRKVSGRLMLVSQ